MSDTGDRNLALGVQESPMDEEGVRVWEAGAEGAVIQDPELHRENAAGLEVVAGSAGSLGVESTAVEVPEGSVSEDSDIGLAGEGEDNIEQGWNVPVEAHQLPMEGFHILFLDVVHTSLNRIYHNDHILERPRNRRRMGLARPHLAGIPGQAHQCTREGAAVMVPEGPGNRATGPEEDTLALEPEAEEEPTQESEAPKETSKNQYENTEEEAQDTERKEEEEEFNKKEGPKSDMDSTE